MNIWLKIASELEELNGSLEGYDNVELKDVRRLQEYRKKLVRLKEQALKNCLQD